MSLESNKGKQQESDESKEKLSSPTEFVNEIQQGELSSIYDLDPD
jgi:hypothetical protein